MLGGLPRGWFETARTGDILARITADKAIVQTVMTSTIPMAARNLILLVGGLWQQARMKSLMSNPRSIAI